MLCQHECKILCLQVLLKKIAFPWLEDPFVLSYILDFLLPFHLKLLQTRCLRNAFCTSIQNRIVMYIERIIILRPFRQSMFIMHKGYVYQSWSRRKFMDLLWFEKMLRKECPFTDLLDASGENTRNIIQTCRMFQPGFVVLKHDAFEVEDIVLDIFAY